MPITINGSGTITGLSAGGLPDGSVQPADLSTGAPTWDTSGNVSISGYANITGKLGVGGANYGSAGQVLTSGGASAAPSWTTISSAPTNAQILSGVASANAGDVGSYGLFNRPGGGGSTTGGSYAGSSLRYSDTGGGQGGTPAGTWRMMGVFISAGTTVYLRIS